MTHDAGAGWEVGTVLEELRSGEIALGASMEDAERIELDEELLVELYDELRRIAGRALQRERAGHTLGATALVHEAYLKLIDGNGGRGWASRRHFYRAAAKLMRNLLVDHARSKRADKRGGDWRKIGLEMVTVALDDVDPALADLGDGLTAFQERYPGPRPGRRAALLRRPHRGRGGRGPRPLPGHRGPALGLRAHLAVRLARKKRGSVRLADPGFRRGTADHDPAPRRPRGPGMNRPPTPRRP